MSREKEKGKKKLSCRKIDHGVSQIPRETTTTPRSAFSPRLPEPIRVPANREKKENTREREISNNVGEFPIFLTSPKPPENQRQMLSYHHEKDP